MNIIVVGCGRVGSQLATLFTQDHNNVVVVDAHAESFATLGRNFEGRVVTGVGFDEDVLIEAGVEECDVIAAVTDVDNSNLMISEVARKLFNVPHVITRLYNPDREGSYMQLGLDYVCGTTLVAEEIYSKVVAEHGGHIDTFGDYEVLRFALDLSSLEVDHVEVGRLEHEHEVRIVVFDRKDGTGSSIPNKDSILYDGDIVLACVHKDVVRHFVKYIGEGL
jgi:trk system potassium uptake protein TrkA